MAATSRPDAPDSRAAGSGPRLFSPVRTPEKPLLADILTASECWAAPGASGPSAWDLRDDWQFRWQDRTRPYKWLSPAPEGASYATSRVLAATYPDASHALIRALVHHTYDVTSMSDTERLIRGGPLMERGWAGLRAGLACGRGSLPRWADDDRGLNGRSVPRSAWRRGCAQHIGA